MIKNYIKLLRIPQWIKNSFVFVPLLFSKNLFNQEYFLTVLAGFLLFSASSSIVYIFNDVIDAEADMVHPQKKSRPIASGAVGKSSAVTLAVGLAAIVLFFLTFFDLKFGIAVGAYILLNLFYSYVFKHIVLLDIFSIAAGFMIRVVSGAYIINVEISSWLILTTMFVSLFLAVMKRGSELRLVSEVEGGNTRKVLSDYSLDFTNQLATIAASGVIICYALYSVSARTVSVFGTEELIYTTPFVVFGIFRYMYLVYMDKKGENTTEVIITDAPMIVNVLLYIITTIGIVYKII